MCVPVLINLEDTISMVAFIPSCFYNISIYSSTEFHEFQEKFDENIQFRTELSKSLSLNISSCRYLFQFPSTSERSFSDGCSEALIYGYSRMLLGAILLPFSSRLMAYVMSGFWPPKSVRQVCNFCATITSRMSKGRTSL